MTKRTGLGKNLAARRKKAGFTQEQLAAIAGIGLTTLKDIERGISWGQPMTRQALATALNCSVDDLFAKPSPQGHEQTSLLELNAVLGRVLAENDALKQKNLMLSARVRELEAEKIANLRKRLDKLRAKDQESSPSPPTKIKRGG